MQRAVIVCVILLCAARAQAQPRPAVLRGTGTLGPFNPNAFQEGTSVSGGLLQARASTDETTQSGYEVAVGRTSFLRPGPLVLHGREEVALRIFPDDGWSASLSRHIIVGGLALGPLEVFGGAGFSTVSVDRLRGAWSFGLFSPLATAGAALRFGRVRIEARAEEEYLWRWTAPDYWLRGVMFGIGLSDP
jgi:hypothetical protein